MLKAFFVLKIFVLLSDFLIMHKNGLIRKLLLNLEFKTSQNE